MAWVILWVGLGLAVRLWVAVTHGRSAATEYFAAYLLEESLSVDNIFVFVVIFSGLHISAEYQRRVLSDAVYRLRYLRSGLAALLAFTAAKMLASEWMHVTTGLSATIIGAVLLATIAASVWQKSTPVPAQ